MMNNQLPIPDDHEDEDWSEFHHFATSIGGSRASKSDAVSPTAEGIDPETDEDLQRFISYHKRERYLGRGHMMQEMGGYRKVQHIERLIQQDLKDSGIDMRDPDMAAIRDAALYAGKLHEEYLAAGNIGLEHLEPRFVRARSSVPPESPGQFEDARSDVEPPNSQMCSSTPPGFTAGSPAFCGVPYPEPRSIYDIIYPENGARAIDQSAMDAFNYKFDESSCVRVDPASLNEDAPTPSPCSSPLPDGQFLPEEMIKSKTDDNVQKVVLPNTSTPLDHQHAPHKPNRDIRDFIFGFKNKLSEHPEILTCFLDVVAAWTNEEIAFSEMKESLTGILESFPDLLEGFMSFTKDIEFPQVSADSSVQPRRKPRNFVVINFLKKEQEKQNGKARLKDNYFSIIKECLSQLRETGVSKELAQRADSHSEGDVVENGEPPLSLPYNCFPYTGGRGRMFSMADVD